MQEELAEAKKLIPDADAGRQLRYSLDQLLKSLEQASRRDPLGARSLMLKLLPSAIK